MRVEPGEAGLTLAAWLRLKQPELSWSAARAACAAGRARIGGAPVTESARRLRAGEVISLAPGSGPGPSGRAEAGRCLRYFDAELAVVAKPAGWLTLPFDPGDRNTLLQRVAVELRRAGRKTVAASGRTPAGGPLRVVQRLDKETSGLLVFARTVGAQRALQQAIGEGKLERIYWAIVAGTWPASADGRLESFLVDDRGDGRRGSFRPRSAAAVPPAGARHAVTQVKRLGALRGATLVECRLETGRTHQIRIHLAEAGHPVLGDAVYGPEHPGRAVRAPRLMLHARRLVLQHPRTGKRLTFDELPPGDYGAVVARLGGWPRGVDIA